MFYIKMVVMCVPKTLNTSHNHFSHIMKENVNKYLEIDYATKLTWAGLHSTNCNLSLTILPY